MSGTSANFDIIVIGAGPAGSATAIASRQSGLKTLIVEADATFRDRPGETLHPGMESVFRRLGVLNEIEQAGFLRHAGHRIWREGQTFFRPYGADKRGVWRGYQATRSELDRILLDRARAAGAEIHRPARAMDVVVENGRTVGVRTSSGVFGTSFVVDAAGPGHWLQRRLELPVLEVSNPLIARFGWESIADQHDGAPEFHVLGCGWRWEAPVQTGKRAWVALELDRISKCRGTKARDVTWRMVRPCAGAGYFLAGDAAFVLDPACSHGVLKALISGVEAGNAAARVLTQGADESAVKATYCSWMESWFCGDASALLSLYADFAPAPSWLESAREALRYISMNPFL